MGNKLRARACRFIYPWRIFRNLAVSDHENEQIKRNEDTSRPSLRTSVRYVTLTWESKDPDSGKCLFFQPYLVHFRWTEPFSNSYWDVVYPFRNPPVGGLSHEDSPLKK